MHRGHCVWTRGSGADGSGIGTKHFVHVVPARPRLPQKKQDEVSPTIPSEGYGPSPAPQSPAGISPSPRNFSPVRAKHQGSTVAVLRDPLLEVPHLSHAAARDDEGHAELTRIHAEHGARVFRFLRGLVGDPALAADATQETFVRAFRQLARFRDGARVAPWLFGIARNVSLEMRKARFRAQRLAPIGTEDVAEAAAPGSPETDLLGREALHVVERALARMSEERRAMLLLRLDHALAYDEIAELMGCSLARVKVEIFRAREILRATMADYERGEER